ncbi:MAG: tRNA glutamyl-Q(34) synthetase GluQRS [Bosea sp.]|nr:tRNA glutamyl-Q(34) synthetase GluQRS [Bosea sp. (in: a-proteobacteria)]
MTPPVLRFAPSPNGALHLGHALSALQNEAEARRLGGRLLLRLEDIDPVRCTPALAEAVMHDLRWLGIAFEPEVRRQSARMPAYADALARLRGEGLIYACDCSRSRIRVDAEALARRQGTPPLRDPDGALVYAGACRGQATASGLPAPRAQRLDMPKAIAAAPRDLGFWHFGPKGAETWVQVNPARWGDVVLARKETPTSYHLAVVMDDADQGVTHVVRGQDLEAQTDIHVLLQALLSLPTPRYQFHPLLRDAEGQKLSKSRSSPSLAMLRAEGISAGDVRRRLGFGS